MAVRLLVSAGYCIHVRGRIDRAVGTFSGACQHLDASCTCNLLIVLAQPCISPLPARPPPLAKILERSLHLQFNLRGTPEARLESRAG